MPRLSLILIVATLSAFGLIASDIYLPAMPAMASAFGVADWRMPQTVSAYLAVLALAQLVYGPLSDRHGRRPLLVAGILIYIIGSLGCAGADSFTAFLAWRMLQAAGAAAGLVIGRAIIADTCDKQASAKVYAVVYPLVSLSPALAPAVGGHLAAAWGWRSDFLFVAAFGAVALLAVLSCLPETRPARQRQTAPAPLAGIGTVLRHAAFRRYSVVVCAIYCAWFIYLTQAPFLFARMGIGAAHGGWMYLPLTAGIILANLVARRLLDRWHYDRIVAAGVACFVLGGLAFAAAAMLRLPGWQAVVLPMCLVSLANGSSLSLAVSGAVAGDHGHAATASGLVGCLQIGSAALAALGVSALFGTSPAVLAGSILVLGLTAACASSWRPAAKPATSA